MCETSAWEAGHQAAALLADGLTSGTSSALVSLFLTRGRDDLPCRVTDNPDNVFETEQCLVHVLTPWGQLLLPDGRPQT